MGVQTIMLARRIVLVVSGENKAETVREAILRPGNASGSGIHPAAAHRCFHRSGRGGTV